MALGLGALTLWLAWFADRHRTHRRVVSRTTWLTDDHGYTGNTVSLRVRRSGKTSSTSSTRRPPSSAAARTATSSSRSRSSRSLCGVLFYLNSGALQPMFDAEFDRAMAIAMRDRIRTCRRGCRAHARLRLAHAAGGDRSSSFRSRSSASASRRGSRGKLVDAKQTFRAALVVARLRVRAAHPRRRVAWTAGAVPRSGAARRPFPPVARRRPVPRSRHGLAAAARGRRTAGSHHDLDHGARRDRPVRHRPHSARAKRRSRPRSSGSWAGCR